MIPIAGHLGPATKLIEHYLIEPLRDKCSLNISLWQPVIHAKKKYVMFTFDVEEDWQPGIYFGGYRYLAPTIRLARELDNEGVKCTFFVTPQVACNRSDSLLELNDMGHEIGVHLHFHNLVNPTYPYQACQDTQLNNLPWELLVSSISKAKYLVEESLNLKTNVFRSGNLSCSPSVERACAISGFHIISNHSFSMKLKTGVFNVDSGIFDICFEGNTAPGLSRIGQTILAFTDTLVLSGHPMLLYDSLRSKPQLRSIKTITETTKMLLQIDGTEFLTVSDFADKYFVTS